MLYLFYPDTAEARASGMGHLAKISHRLAAGGPSISEEAATGQLVAVGSLLVADWDNVAALLRSIRQPVLYANGMHDVMTPAMSSFRAGEQVPDSARIAQPTEKEIATYRDTFRRELDKRMDAKHPSASPSTEAHEIALRQFVENRNAAARSGPCVVVPVEELDTLRKEVFND